MTDKSFSIGGGRTVDAWHLRFALLLVLVPLPCPLARADVQPPSRPGGPADPGWMARVREEIVAREYEPSWQEHPGMPELGPAWQAPNRAHGLRTYFREDGIHVLPRTEAEPSWALSLSLVGYGRGATVWPVGEATLSLAGNRIDYRRASLEEWYVNGPQGLKQEFRLWAPPEEAADGAKAAGRAAAPGRDRGLESAGLVHLELRLGGTLLPVVSADGQAIDFVHPGGGMQVRYAELLVTDAAGGPVPAWMEGAADEAARGIRLVLDDREAVYPITIDPLITSGWTAEGDQDGALFGLAVGPAGDVNGDGYTDVIVGAIGFDNGMADEGAAFVYEGSASGPSSTPSWTAEGEQASALYGISVATAGDVNADGFADVIVGAFLFDNGQVDEGRAFVYHGSASGLSASPSWIAESNGPGARFGTSVGTAGDVNGDGYSDVIVGANLFVNDQGDEGRAFVYLGSASGLSSSPSWTAEGDQAGARFGNAVGTAGDVNGDGYADVIVGAYGLDNGQNNEGRAYVYHGSGAGPSAIANRILENDHAEAFFGYAAGTAGDVNGDGYADVIVGAYRDYTDPSTPVQTGRVYLYYGSSAGVSSIPDWTADGTQLGGSFGSSVGTAGDVNGDGYADVIVGADGLDTNGITNAGRASLYYGSAQGLPPAASWSVDGDQSDGFFGAAVATAGDVNGDGYADVIVGAYGHDDGQIDEGRAFLYLGSPAVIAPAAAWRADGDGDGARFGFSVGTAGDVNGDGYADVIVGAPFYDNGEPVEGRAFAYLGSAAGLSSTPAWTAESNQAFAEFAWVVGTAGDVNGDGYADVIVGARFFDNGTQAEGRVFVYHGSVAGLSPTPAWTAEGDQPGASFGSFSATAGDVNGDGYADVIVGATGFDNGQEEEGRAYVYLGSVAGLAPIPAWTAESDQAGARFGATVATAGDVNGDGYADVIVGACFFDNEEVDQGRVFVYHGSAAGLSASPAWIAESDQAGSGFCVAATAGDVNGDAYADVIVGAFYYSDGQEAEGRAFAYHGSAAGLSATPAWTAEQGDQGFGYFGILTATAGDVNGDGYADVIVGASGLANTRGAAFVYLGSAAGLASTAVSISDATTSNFGAAAGSAGDVNGDGYADVVVGASETGFFAPGAALVYYGNASAGLSVQPQQRRADDSAPIPPGGRSDASDEFRLAALGRTPFGRGQVRLQWEVKPLGVPFDGTSLDSTGPLDTGIAGVPFTVPVTGLPLGNYHWRMRLLYDPVTTPFAPASRWFTQPVDGWEQIDLRLAADVGGFVWDDLDGDGIRDPGEPGIEGLTIGLEDPNATVLAQTTSLSDGSYRFALQSSDPVRLRFLIHPGVRLTSQDQGADDTVDSDANPIDWLTPVIPGPFALADATRWSAGLIPCVPIPLPLRIVMARHGIAGTPILDVANPNPAGGASGYAVYRSVQTGASPEAWSTLAYDVGDEDPGTGGIQWTDTTGDALAPGTGFFYQVTAVNPLCQWEGPR